MAATNKTRFWRRVLITAVIAALLLVVANSAYWVSRTIFDSNNFTRVAVASVTSDSSRQAIADEVVDRALKDVPVIKEIAGPTASKLVGSLLATNQFSHLLESATSRLHVYLTSNNRESIVLNLGSVKNVLGSLISLAGDSDGQNAARIDTVPDQIVLVDSSDIPDFYRYGMVFLWLGPITAIAALLLLAYPYIRDRSKYYIIALAQGVSIAVVGLLCLLVGPLFRPPVLAGVDSVNSRIVVGNLYDAFVNTFNHQSLNLVKVGIVIAVLPLLAHFGLEFYHKRKAAAKKTAQKP